MKDGVEESKASCERVDLGMADGKMVVSLLQLSGSYCTMCTRSQTECQNLMEINKGFLIDRSIETLSDLALSLFDPDTGKVTKSKSDYAM